MKRLMPALTLSALLVSPDYGVDWSITGIETKSINSQTINGVELIGNGQLTVNSSGTSTIDAMDIIFPKNGISAIFNINDRLNLDLGITNTKRVSNSVSFNVNQNATLNLTKKIFRGINTTLNASVLSGGTLIGSINNDADNAQSTIRIAQGGTMQGNIVQTGGILDATIEGRLEGNINANDSETKLWANVGQAPTNPKTSTITGDIVIEKGSLIGEMRNLVLEGSLIQNRGKSDIAFWYSTFETNTTLTNADALIHFYGTTLKSISVSNGSAIINLKVGSKMENYIGNANNGTINLTDGSSMLGASQMGGINSELKINANNSSINGSITGISWTDHKGVTRGSNLIINATNSKIDGGISNTAKENGDDKGKTSITLANQSTITGSIAQTNGRFDANFGDSILEGSFTQNGGKLGEFISTNSTIGQGLVITSATPVTKQLNLNFSKTTITNGGIRIKTLKERLKGEIKGKSTINGGYDQTSEKTNRKQVYLIFSDSVLNGGVQVRGSGGTDQPDPSLGADGYATVFNFKKNSTLNGGVISTDHSISITLQEQSALNGGVQVSKGDVRLSGLERASTFNGDISIEKTRFSSLNLVESTLNGNFSQNGHHWTSSFDRQEISLSQGSKINGNISNIDTKTEFKLLASELNGAYTQENGSLFWMIGDGSIVHQNIMLNEVATKLQNGSAKNKVETFKGNFTQDGGSLSGDLTGLTLEGFFTQNGGTSNIIFRKANFHQPTTINAPEQLGITFDNQSNLKTTTIIGLPVATAPLKHSFTLDDRTILEGDFILKDSVKGSSITLAVKNCSKITGKIEGDANSNIKLDFSGNGCNGGNPGNPGNGGGNEIGGGIDIGGGDLEGDITDTTITGGIKLEDATTHVHIKNSIIKGGVDITRGSSMITLDGATIQDDFKMTGEDKNGGNPTLKLIISNKSSISEDLVFTDTKAFLGGGRDGKDTGGNTITGSLKSINSTLTNGGKDYTGGAGDSLPLVGLTIGKNLEQTNGVLDLTMKTKSAIEGSVLISDTEKSYLTMSGESTLKKIKVTNSKDTKIKLDDNSSQSFQGIGIEFENSKASIEASDRSTITTNINVSGISSEAGVYLNGVPNKENSGSTMTGNITQRDGESLAVGVRDKSYLEGNITVSNVKSVKIDILNNSDFKGLLTTNRSPTEITIENESVMESEKMSPDDAIIMSSSKLDVTVKDSSSLIGRIIHNGGVDAPMKMQFENKSLLDSQEIIITGPSKLGFDASEIQTSNIQLSNGRLGLTFDNKSMGTIKNMETGGMNGFDILTQGKSVNTIENLEIRDRATLTLTAKNNGTRILGNLTMTKFSTASIASLDNAWVEFDILPQDSSTLEIALNGGGLQGKITQTAPTIGTMAMASGGRWIMTEDSWVKNLTINNSASVVNDQGEMNKDTKKSSASIVDLMARIDDQGNLVKPYEQGWSLVDANTTPQAGQTKAKILSLSTLNGLNGVFRVYTDIDAGLADRINMQKAVGSHYIQVYYKDFETADQDLGDKYIVVAHVDDEKTTVDFKSKETVQGTKFRRHELLKVDSRDNVGWDWILGNVISSGISHSSNVIASILQSQYRTFALHTETLNQRLGELKDIHRIDGLWARYSMGSNATKESKNHLEVKDDFYNAWFGYDQNSLSLKGQNFFGFALSYMLVSPESRDYTGSIHNIGFNFYDTFVAKNDFYFDVVAKYILSYGMYDISYQSLSQNAPKYLNHKLMASFEIGKKFKLGQKKRNYFYLQPEAQITSGYIVGNDLVFVDSSNTKINANLAGNIPVIMRAGLTGAYAMEYASFKGDVRLGTSIVYEVGNGGQVKLDDGINDTVRYNYKGNFHLLLQAGANVMLNDSSRIYFEASTGFFGDTSTTYAINLGLRFNFGAKNTRKLKVPSDVPPPPPPSVEYDPRNIPVITDNTTIDIRNNNTQIKRKPRNMSDYFINTRKNYRDVTSLENR